MNYYNFYLEGKAKEKVFAEAYCTQYGLDVREVVQFASPSQDRWQGFDLMIEGTTYDVKSQKRINRKDTTYSNEYTWIELKTVDGRPGSGVDGAEVKAYEDVEDFICVKKEDIIRLIFRRVEFVFDDFPLYKLKTRPNRKDLITLVPTIDLREIAIDTIPKLII